ncbi:hypothetical protein DZC31_02280 [Stenotrophomonas rhizophila]|nr:hypothetical protein DZC31_02280 [Stenotrophomonas rhizophila]
MILGKAHYMQSFTSQAVNGEMLEAYVQELSSLVRQTETQLSNVLASIESGAAPALPRPPHRVRPGRRMLIRTSHGRSVLVERDQAGQRAVLRNPSTSSPQAPMNYVAINGTNSLQRSNLRHRAAQSQAAVLRACWRKRTSGSPWQRAMATNRTAWQTSWTGTSTTCARSHSSWKT